MPAASCALSGPRSGAPPPRGARPGPAVPAAAGVGRDGAGPTGRAGGCAAAWAPERGGRGSPRAAGAMTGVEAEQEFDFDFLFEYKHSDEGGGGGGSRPGRHLRGSRGRDAAGRGGGGGPAGGPSRAGGRGGGDILGPAQLRGGERGAPAASSEILPGASFPFGALVSVP